jgi:hypothetical protein
MSAGTPGLNGSVAATLEQAARWHLLGRLFERPHGSWWADVGALRESCGDQGLLAAAHEARLALEGDYLAALGPGGLVSPREVAHRPLADPGALLAELQAIYAAFAYVPATLADEPPDHVAVEAAFVAFLRLKQAYAQARGDADRAELCARAAAQFENDHLRVLSGPLARRLADGPRHLALAAQALRDRLGTLPDADSELSVHGSASPLDGCTFACGGDPDAG